MVIILHIPKMLKFLTVLLIKFQHQQPLSDIKGERYEN